jgi:hypothetical protein
MNYLCAKGVFAESSKREHSGVLCDMTRPRLLVVFCALCIVSVASSDTELENTARKVKIDVSDSPFLVGKSRQRGDASTKIDHEALTVELPEEGKEYEEEDWLKGSFCFVSGIFFFFFFFFFFKRFFFVFFFSFNFCSIK